MIPEGNPVGTTSINGSQHCFETAALTSVLGSILSFQQEWWWIDYDIVKDETFIGSPLQVISSEGCSKDLGHSFWLNFQEMAQAVLRAGKTGERLQWRDTEWWISNYDDDPIFHNIIPSLLFGFRHCTLHRLPQWKIISMSEKAM